MFLDDEGDDSHLMEESILAAFFVKYFFNHKQLVDHVRPKPFTPGTSKVSMSLKVQTLSDFMSLVRDLPDYLVLNDSLCVT